MIISAFLGVSGLNDVGYAFYSPSEVMIGSRVTSGITPGAPGYYSASVTLPIGAASVRWNSAGTPDAAAVEYFETILQPPATADPNLGVVQGYLRKPDGSIAAGVQLIFTLNTPSAIKSDALIANRQVTAASDRTGYFQVSLERNDLLIPSGSTWSVRCLSLGWPTDKQFTLAAPVLNLASIV